MSIRAPATDLPVAAVGDALLRALGQGSAVLTAPPGSGKTTFVPLLLAEGVAAGQRIIVVTPRQVAARAAARRMAALIGDEVGARVGYRVRWDRRSSNETRVLVVTEGVLLRMLEADPELPGTHTVILDEFHERSLDADLALGLLMEVRETLRPDLRVLVMSATIDAAPVAALLGDAEVVRAEGRQYPVGVHHRPLAARPTDDAAAFAAGVADAVRDAMGEADGDALVFLPGMREMRAVADHLARDAPGRVHLLHGSLLPAEQDAALAPASGRKIILATPIAQTSLTVEGVGIVIDSGWHRLTRFDARAGADRLVTERISRAAADQRAGRAGRLGPGTCWRLWSADAHSRLPAQDQPEILRADLAAFVLRAECWGRGASRTLSLLDPPTPVALERAEQLLRSLGALDDAGAITAAGREMARLPLAPRLAAMLQRAREAGYLADAIWVAACLEDTAATGRTLAQRAAAVTAQPRDGAGRRLVADLARALGVDDSPKPAPDRAAHLGLVASWAFPERVARRRAGDDGRYLCADGGELVVEPADSTHAEWLVAPEWEPRQPRRARLVAPLDGADVAAGQCGAIRETEHVAWDPRQDAVVAERRRMLGRIVLDAEPLPSVPPERCAELLAEAIAARGIGALPWNESARGLQSRMASVRTWHPDEGWPAVDDAALQADLPHWLLPWLAGMSRFSHLSAIDLETVLRSALSHSQLRELDVLAPETVPVPSGHRVRLQYGCDGEPPILAVKLQAVFGLAETPRIDGGRMRVRIHLLSPAGRPLQVTQDLASFWRDGYREVAREMRGRYPKHPWPDDPLSASPMMGTKRRHQP